MKFLFNSLLIFGTNLDWCKPAEVIFFYQEGHSALVQKNYQTKAWQIGTYTTQSKSQEILD